MRRRAPKFRGPTRDDVVGWLVGQPLTYLGHLAATGDLGFGRPMTILDELGRTRTVSPVAVHVQCPWRIASGERILIGSADIFAPAFENAGQRASEEEFDWEKDQSRFDERAGAMLRGPSLVAGSASIGRFGLLIIRFLGGEVFEAFPDGSLEREAWRAFRMDSGCAHFVASTSGPAPGGAQ